MIDHMLFNKAFWINRTPDAKQKLDNYDNLKSRVDSLQRFKNKVMRLKGTKSVAIPLYGNQLLDFDVQDDGTISVSPDSSDPEFIHYTKLN